MEIIAKYFLLALCYAFGGWICEEITCSISEKKLVDRGFLIGPVCPIYGWGGLFITLALTRFSEYPVVVFVMAVFLCAILEYSTSYFMEKIFKARWWDYSDKKFNINGRICLETLFPFGILGLVVIYVLNPILTKCFLNVESNVLIIVACVLAGILILDTIVSFHVVSKVTETAKKIRRENIKDNTNEITAKVREELKESAISNRLLNAFPKWQAIKVKVKKAVKESTTKIENKAKAVQKEAGKIAKKSEEAIQKHRKKKKKDDENQEK